MSIGLLAALLAQTTIAVVGVEARHGAAEAQASAMNDAVVSQLVSDNRVKVVERQQIAKIMKEQALSMSGVVSDDSQIKVAQLVGARFVATGAVQPSGRSLSISLRAIDSSSAQVVFAESLTVGSAEQIEAGGRQLSRRMADKITGSASSGNGEVAVGDFDPAQVKDGARSLARSLAMRFPKLTGRVTESLPDGTVSCAFEGAQPFAGQFFEIDGKDEVTGQVGKKGYFLLRNATAGACSGPAKREMGAAITKGDQLIAMPLRINVEALEPAAGAQPELAQLVATELKAALDTVPNFRVANDAQLTAMGRVAGARGHRSVELQLIDKGGNVVQKLDLPVAF